MNFGSSLFASSGGTEGWKSPWSVPGTFSKLKIKLAAAPGGGNSIQFNVRKNGSSTGVTLTISGSNTEGSDLSNSFSVAAGDLLSLQLVVTGTPASLGNTGVTYSVQFEPTTDGMSGYSGFPGFPGSTSAERYTAPLATAQPSVGTWSSTATSALNICPIAGTITRGDVFAVGSPGGGTSYSFYIYKNGVKQDGTGGTPNTLISLSGSNTQANASFSLSVSAGDTLRIGVIGVSSPSHIEFACAFAFQASTPGEFIIAGWSNVSFITSTSTPQYTKPQGQATFNVSDADLQPGSDLSLYLDRLYMLTDVAPGGSAVHNLFLRKNSADTDLHATITGSNLSGSDLVHSVIVISTDLINVKSVATVSTPTSGNFSTWSMRASSTASVAPNEPPVVDAGPDQVVAGLSTTTAAVEFDPDSGPSPLTGLWTKVSGPGTATFGDDTDPTTSLTVSVAGYYRFRRTVTDGEDEASDTVVMRFGTITGEDACPSGPWGITIDEIARLDRALLETINFEYTLGAVGRLTAAIKDEGARTTALRPGNEERVVVTKTSTVFTGRIVDTQETPLGDNNEGTRTTITCLDYFRALTRRRFTKSYGAYEYIDVQAGEFTLITERRTNYLIYQGSNSTLIGTVYPHKLFPGDRIKITGAVEVSPDINFNEYEVVTTPTPAEITIAETLTVDGTSGVIHKLTPLSVILSDLQDLLDDYGISFYPLADDPYMMPVSFDLATIKDVLDEISLRLSMIYHLTPDLVLRIFAPGDRVASVTFSAGNANVIGPAPQSRLRSNYANKLWAKGGQRGEIVLRRTTWVSDGSQVAFPMEDPDSWEQIHNMTHPGYIHVVGTPTEPLTGLYPADYPLMEWTFDKENKVVYRNTTTPVDSVVEFLFYGDGEYVISEQDDDAIAELDGEIYDDVIPVDSSDTEESAREKLRAALALRAVTERRATIKTKVCLILPGTVVPVDLPDVLMSGNWMVVSVRGVSSEAREPNGGEPIIFYTYDLLEEGSPATYLDFWKKIVG